MATSGQPIPFIDADEELSKVVGNFGAHSLDNCYQCGTCSVVCPLTPEEHAFPRKEMIWSQWGLKDKLLSDIDVWMCYRCNDCVTHCPTDSKPGDVMAGIRDYQITSYAFPRIFARAGESLKLLPFVFIIPALAVAALIGAAIMWPNGGGIEFPGGSIEFAHLIPEHFIDITTFALLGFIAALSSVGFYRFWRNIQTFQATSAEPKVPLPKAAATTLLGIFSHKAFKSCGTNWTGFYSHLGIFYGFLLLVMATTGAFVYTVVLDWIGIGWQDNRLSLPLWDPVKILGNAGGVFLLVAASWAIYNRLANKEGAGTSAYFDWFFVAVLYITTLTGFLLEALRFADTKAIAYSTYLVHLLFVYTLFAYFPYSKFAHIGYRTIALIYAEHIGRKQPEQAGASASGVVAAGPDQASPERTPVTS